MFRPLLAAAAAALVFAAPAAAAPYDDAAYWAFADRSQQQQFDDRWDEQAGYYKMGGGGVEPMANSMLLLTHAVAAMDGHTGPARNDHRARILAERLVSGTPYVTKPGAGQAHAPGWVNTMNGAPGGQHLVFDAEVVDGLVYAYRAREALQLPSSTVEKIRNAIHRTARGKFWRYPTIRLNQVNWYALMYAADATVTGDNTLLKRDMHLQLKRFFSQTRAGASRIGNFGPGMRFHYLPHMSTQQPLQRRLRRVLEHRPDLHALLRPGPPRRHARPRSERPPRHARVDHARRLRLLDARRLHELGLRPGLQPLAPGQEARSDAGGARRPRVLGHPAPERQVGPVGQVDARQRLRLLRAAVRALA